MRSLDLLLMRGRTLSQRAKSLANRLGASILLPQPGYVYSDSDGTTPAVQDGVVGCIKDSCTSGVIATQSTAGYKPILRRGAKNYLLNSATLLDAIRDCPRLVDDVEHLRDWLGDVVRNWKRNARWNRRE